MKKTVCVLSGGMDSATLAYLLTSVRDEVKAVSFFYGQRHRKELESAKAIAQMLGIDHKVIDISFLQELVSNSALTGDIEVPEGHYEDENMKLTVVPNRNAIMANIAIGYAVNIGFDEIALGVHAGDHAIYPDCRPEFITALDAMSKIANFQPVSVYAPFLTFDKGDICRLGTHMGVDYSKTWTCYKGQDKPCGKCGSCQERAEAFIKAGVKDPLME